MTRTPLFFLIILGSFHFTASASLQFDQITPDKVYVGVGGEQGRLIIDGAGLNSIRSFEMVYGNKKSDYMLIQPVGKEDQRREIILLTRPDTPLGSGFKLYAVTQENTQVRIPVEIQVVQTGDQRLQQDVSTTSLRESVLEATTSRIVVERNQAPLVEATLPDPLVVPPTGEAFTFRIAGTNLDQITDVRVRPGDEPAKYRKNEGKLPHRTVDFGIEVDVMASPNSNQGDGYILDLMVDRFLAVSLPFEVGTPAVMPPPVITDTPVIDLPPIEPID